MAGIDTQKMIKKVKENLKNIPSISCQICQDGKFVHPKIDGKVDYSRVIPCQCVRAEMEKQKHEALIKYCELPEKGRYMTFDNFKATKASQEAFAACQAIAEGESEYNFLTLMGHSNHGKTHLAIAVCNYRLSQNKPAKYTYVPLLLQELRDGFRKDGDGSYMSRYNIFLNVPLLLMDDLGVENDTPWVQEHLNTLVDYRLMHQLPTVITTNLPFNELPFRIANRLKRDGKIIAITGPEFEGKK
jgi:DNA replication protein DnaC